MYIHVYIRTLRLPPLLFPPPTPYSTPPLPCACAESGNPPSSFQHQTWITQLKYEGGKAMMMVAAILLMVLMMKMTTTMMMIMMSKMI